MGRVRLGRIRSQIDFCSGCRNYDLGRPEAATLPLALKEQLKPLIARPFQTEAEFLARPMPPNLTEDEMKSHRATVLKISERTVDIFDRVGGGLEALVHYRSQTRGLRVILIQPEFRDGVIDLMRQIQLADSSWTTGGQFAGMQRWNPASGQQIKRLPMWTTLTAFTSCAAHRIRRDLRRFRKPLLINGNRRRISIIREWLAMRLLFERQFRSTADVAKTAKIDCSMLGTARHAREVAGKRRI